MNLSINGVFENVITLKNNNLSVGDIVTVDSNYTVSKPNSDSEIFGLITNIRGDYVSVQITGAMKLTYTGAAPALGIQGIVYKSDNKVATSNTAKRKCLVVNTNDLTKTVDLILI